MDEVIAEKIASDSYLKNRKAPTEAEQQLYLKEISFTCPLCGKDLRNRIQKKNNKLYEIAHIFPNSPTEEQYKILEDLPRLGDNSESFENKIALCKDCHAQQDYHTTKEDYLNLLEKKQHLLQCTELRDTTLTLGLEADIAAVVRKIYLLREDELASLNYNPVILAKKFSNNDSLLKTRVSAYVTNYYPYIRDLFKDMEGKNGFRLETISLQIKCCFIKMEAISNKKSDIFNHIVDWINTKTLCISKEACEAIVSFFVQNCEVFYEITK